MTGISGWHVVDFAGNQTEAIASRMSESLPSPGEPKKFTSDRSALACRLDTKSMATDPGAGLYVAIEGEPRWHSGTLTNIATVSGNGAALMSAYKSLGTELFQELSGPFAIAVIDERTDRVLLAVDRMGIRPMCYAVTQDHGLVFGSTADAILAHGQIDSGLSAQSIYNYVYFHIIPSPSTIFDEIHKLEPSQFVLLESGSLRKGYHWTPQFTKSTNASEDYLQNELMQTMRSAIARASTDERTGAFLSGGLDSSTICGLANELVEQPLHSYSIGFGQTGYDEISFARIAAEHFGLSLREYYVTPEDIADAMPIIAAAYDEPFGNSSAVPAYFCAKMAKSDGTQCLLAGDGGDELFAGNTRYTTQRIFEYYNRIPSVLRKKVLEPAVFGLPTEWSKLTHKIRRYVEQARVPLPERLQTYNYLHMEDPGTVFESNFLAEIDVRRPVDEMESWFSRGADFELVDNMLMFDWKLTLADNDIRKVNRMCEVAGIGVKYPFLDDELVNFSTRVPADLKLRNRQLRYFFKKSLDNFLPREIIEKKKHGFGLPFGDWLISSSKLREAVIPPLKCLGDRGIFRKEFIESLLVNHQTAHAAFYGNMIWVLVMLEYWLQAHGHTANLKKY